MFKNPLNLLGFILIIVALLLATLLVRYKSFKRQDILLIIAYLISGIIFLNQKWYRQELTQVNIILLTIPTFAYTIESVRLKINR